MTRLHKGLVVGVVLLAMAAVVVWLQAKPWLEARIHRQLEAAGLKNIEFHIASVGLHGIGFENITFGHAYRLDALTLDFQLAELLSGNLRGFHSGNLIIKQGGKTFTLKNAEATFTSIAGGMTGVWHVEEITGSELPLEIPALRAEGKMRWEGRALSIDGNLASDDKKYKAAFALDYPTAKPDKAVFRLASATLPWNGGTLSTRDVEVPLNKTTPILVRLNVHQVSLNALMQQTTNKRASATGVISGMVPVSIDRNGNFIFKTGTLQALNGGTLVLPPETIPGDNPQVALVRELLTNFHYSVLSLGVSSGKDDKLSMLLSLQGNNPDVYNGRAVKLNVNLTGDVLDLLKQSLALKDPKKMIEQGKHEKK